ncbi:TonB-dependent receptor domain-containing protein [Paraflavitalea pollutisoli]|uniref:TonB-dependent receptor domain-containing protein n=1 Tax=Paraflavitalea pollutisoli TaxID=3034143 RepID=UPI0023EB4964|nr:TonB-dependent receptor [Paraflavitalea sp. H1-2-19X]
MKPNYIYFLTLLLFFAGLDSIAQSTEGMMKDSIITFKVLGACDQCKNRIENAAKGKGVHSATWDIESKLLTLTFLPGKTSVEKVQNRIVAVGHDLETRKAKDVAYNQLPKCCYYREMPNMEGNLANDTLNQTMTDTLINGSSSVIKGVVLETDKTGIFRPLPGATVSWIGTVGGSMTDTNGVFRIVRSRRNSRLAVSYSGFNPDTLTVIDNKELKIVLASSRQLKEVVVTSKQRSTYLSALNPIRTQVMTEKELFKAACCNLSESFETNPSVDVSYTDAVTGSKQIQLLGLSGNYTQLTVENLPGPRGIATPLGLNSIAGPWIESIQLTKGIGSVANGYESIAGQINVELKKPENSEQLYANAYVNDFGKTDLNLNLSKKIGKKWSTGLLLHNDFWTNKRIDFNNDGFRDLPTGNLFSAISRWKYDDGKGFLTQFGIKAMIDNKTGGAISYDPSTDKFTTNHYGIGINTQRYEAFAKIGYVFPQKVYKSIGLQVSAFGHHQDSYFGLTGYNASQQSLYANLIYQSIISSTIHKFRTGISFQYDKYKEDFRKAPYERREVVPGAFFEYTYTPSEKFSTVAGFRVDHNNLFGLFVTPRLHVRYEPVTGTTIRVSAGRGQRTANIFAENSSVFVSSRQVNILNGQPGKAYGLNPEIAWNKGITIDQKLRLFDREATASLDYYRNDFTDQVVVDLEDVRQVKFYNLKGKSYSNSFQAELNFEPIKKVDVRLAYRYYDVKTTYSNKLLQRPFIAPDRAFANLAYSINGWKLDYTINYNGRKRLPVTDANPFPYQKQQYSPDYILMNTQVSKTVGKKHPMDFYIGAENLTNYFQKDPIIAADQPFSPYFDASLVWAPITGRMFYAGWRFKLK